MLFRSVSQSRYEVNRPVGLGYMGLADLFLRYGIKYGSVKSINLLREITSAIKHISYEESEKGNIVDCRVEFCNDCFTYDDNVLFCNYLTSKGYKTNPIKRGSFYRARMSLYDAQRFFVEINQYVVPSMKYKLYMGIDRPWMTQEYKELKSYISAQSLAFKQV